LHVNSRQRETDPDREPLVAYRSANIVPGGSRKNVLRYGQGPWGPPPASTKKKGGTESCCLPVSEPHMGVSSWIQCAAWQCRHTCGRLHVTATWLAHASRALIFHNLHNIFSVALWSVPLGSERQHTTHKSTRFRFYFTSIQEDINADVRACILSSPKIWLPPTTGRIVLKIMTNSTGVNYVLLWIHELMHLNNAVVHSWKQIMGQILHVEIIALHAPIAYFRNWSCLGLFNLENYP
jgi:hypothetical protein